MTTKMKFLEPEMMTLKEQCQHIIDNKGECIRPGSHCNTEACVFHAICRADVSLLNVATNTMKAFNGGADPISQHTGHCKSIW